MSAKSFVSQVLPLVVLRKRKKRVESKKKEKARDTESSTTRISRRTIVQKNKKILVKKSPGPRLKPQALVVSCSCVTSTPDALGGRLNFNFL